MLGKLLSGWSSILEPLLGDLILGGTESQDQDIGLMSHPMDAVVDNTVLLSLC